MSYDDLRAYAGLIGLLCFMAAFVAIIWWAYKPSSRKLHEEHGNIPFKEGS
jgi:cbb3-type cytochrome oxidase subunit 3